MKLMFSLTLLFFASLYAKTSQVSVVDFNTKHLIQYPVFVSKNHIITGDSNGTLHLPSTCHEGWIKAQGYKKIKLSSFKENAHIQLTPFFPKGVYLSLYGTSSQSIRHNIMNMIEKKQINTLVIDVKNGEGYISVPVDNPIASMSGAQRIQTVPALKGLLKELKKHDVYTIARIAVFKDDKLARFFPEWAITHQGSVFKDRQGMRWTDPFLLDVQEYTIDVALAAARIGFDEIQFDYIRFPDRTGLHFSKEANQTTRTNTITRFLSHAYQRLATYGSYVSADIFGYAVWKHSDIGLGQHLESLSRVVDYLSPMLYPSGFSHGIPNYPNPMESTYEIIYHSLNQARKRTGKPARYFRPWLQAFRDYAFDHRLFKTHLVSKQILATKHIGAHGWLLWNARNRYDSIFPLKEATESP
jgi:hypothetical protein